MSVKLDGQKLASDLRDLADENRARRSESVSYFDAEGNPVSLLGHGLHLQGVTPARLPPRYFNFSLLVEERFFTGLTPAEVSWLETVQDLDVTGYQWATCVRVADKRSVIKGD